MSGATADLASVSITLVVRVVLSLSAPMWSLQPGYSTIDLTSDSDSEAETETVDSGLSGPVLPVLYHGSGDNDSDMPASGSVGQSQPESELTFRPSEEGRDDPWTIGSDGTLVPRPSTPSPSPMMMEMEHSIDSQTTVPFSQFSSLQPKPLVACWEAMEDSPVLPSSAPSFGGAPLPPIAIARHLHMPHHPAACKLVMYGLGLT